MSCDGLDFGLHMRINLHLHPNAALPLHEGAPGNASSKELLLAAKKLGVTVIPVYPGTRSKQLKTHFVVEVPDEATAVRVLDKFRGLAATETAYLKPEDALP